MKTRLFLAVFILISFVPTNSIGFTDIAGIEENDEVNLDYVLSYDGAVQQNGPDFTTIVSNSRLIEGFYLGLLGMYVGQQKNIVVPTDKGYPPSHELGGKILYFDVTINEIVTNVRGDNYVPPVQSDTVVLFNFADDGVRAEEDSIFQNIISSPIVIAASVTGFVLVVYLKTSGTKVVEHVAPKNVTSKMTAQEKLRKRREEVDKKLQND